MKKTNLSKFFLSKRLDFKILDQSFNSNKLIYVDNSATTQKPKIVIDSISNFYNTYNSNIHRSAHFLADKADYEYENVRFKVSKLINCNKNEVIFTSGATSSLNILANGICGQLNVGDEIVLTTSEHHANLVTWQEVAKKTGAILKFIPIDSNYELDLVKAKKIISNKTKIISISYISNVLGTINDVFKISKLAKKVNSLFFLDATQAVPHLKVDFKKIDCDALVASSHKMLGPTGVGILVGKFSFLEKLKPSNFGGDMIYEVELEKSTYNKVPYKFEAGTPNICSVIGFGVAIDYLLEIGFDKIEAYELELSKYFLEEISKIKGLKLYGSSNYKKRIGVFSFNLEGIHSHDLGTILNNFAIASRSGHHCAMPLHNKLNINSTTRISFYFYNTFDEIDKIVKVLKKAKEIYNSGKFLL